MNESTALMVKETLADDMMKLGIEGLARYGNKERLVSHEEEAAYRLCHHDFFGLTQGEAAQVLGITQQGVDWRLKTLRAKAPQLFPILSRNVAAIYNRFVTDNMSVKEIADDMNVTPRYCWQVLQDLWDDRKNNGLYFRTGTRQQLHYRPWMDEHIKENF
jgi:hypothetical protein